jgi:branched-subunit amino acid ABC-type transport system permease component
MRTGMTIRIGSVTIDSGQILVLVLMTGLRMVVNRSRLGKQMTACG